MGQRLVAKQSRFDEDLSKGNRQFHVAFCKAQSLAAKFAEDFNARISNLVDDTTARVQFLPCFIYEVLELGDLVRSVLAEKLLDNSRYKKWNTNTVTGWVDSD